MLKTTNAWTLVATMVPWAVPALAIPATQSQAAQVATVPAKGMSSCLFKDVAGEVLCGTVDVREDRTRGAGRRIALNVAVLKARGTGPALEPLFIFVGGPGQAATADVSSNARRFATIRASRDIVMIDQRGTGRSNPLKCSFGTPVTAVRALVAGELPLDFVTNCRRNLERSADLRFYTTAVAADDVEETRRHLGYGRINVYGGSYGSRAALVYLRRYPRSVRTATLRSVFPLDLRNPLYASRDAQQAFDLLVSDCAADPGCGAAYPKLADTFGAVMERLALEPARSSSEPSAGSEELAITAPIFAGLVRRMLYSANGQAAVPAVIFRAAAGDFSMVRPAIAQTLAIQDDLAIGMFLSVTCAEDVRFIRRSDLRGVPGTNLFGTGAVRSLFEACRAWPKGIAEPLQRLPPRDTVPTLLLSGSTDPVTPPSYAERVASTLSNVRSVVMKGEAHGPFSECGISMMTDFIASGSLPQADPSCLADLKRPAFLILSKAEPKHGA